MKPTRNSFLDQLMVLFVSGLPVPCADENCPPTDLVPSSLSASIINGNIVLLTSVAGSWAPESSDFVVGGQTFDLLGEAGYSDITAGNLPEQFTISEGAAIAAATDGSNVAYIIEGGPENDFYSVPVTLGGQTTYIPANVSIPVGRFHHIVNPFCCYVVTVTFNAVTFRMETTAPVQSCEGCPGGPFTCPRIVPGFPDPVEAVYANDPTDPSYSYATAVITEPPRGYNMDHGLVELHWDPATSEFVIGGYTTFSQDQPFVPNPESVHANAGVMIPFGENLSYYVGVLDPNPDNNETEFQFLSVHRGAMVLVSRIEIAPGCCRAVLTVVGLHGNLPTNLDLDNNPTLTGEIISLFFPE